MSPFLPTHSGIMFPIYHTHIHAHVCISTWLSGRSKLSYSETTELPGSGRASACQIAATLPENNKQQISETPQAAYKFFTYLYQVFPFS